MFSHRAHFNIDEHAQLDDCVSTRTRVHACLRASTETWKEVPKKRAKAPPVMLQPPLKSMSTESSTCQFFFLMICPNPQQCWTPKECVVKMPNLHCVRLLVYTQQPTQSTASKCEFPDRFVPSFKRRRKGTKLMIFNHIFSCMPSFFECIPSSF